MEKEALAEAVKKNRELGDLWGILKCEKYFCVCLFSLHPCPNVAFKLFLDLILKS